MLNKKTIFLLLLVITSCRQLAFGKNQVIGIDFTWDVVDGRLISDAIVTVDDFSCGKESYTYEGSYFNDTTHILTMNVAGPFSTDYRTVCKVGSNQVYFSEEGMVVDFSYAGVPHTCYINELIGTSHDNYTGQYDKLQGKDSGHWIACGDSTNIFEYRVNAGHDQIWLDSYNHGSVEIKSK